MPLNASNRSIKRETGLLTNHLSRQQSLSQVWNSCDNASWKSANREVCKLWTHQKYFDMNRCARDFFCTYLILKVFVVFSVRLMCDSLVMELWCLLCSWWFKANTILGRSLIITLLCYRCEVNITPHGWFNLVFSAVNLRYI